MKRLVSLLFFIIFYSSCDKEAPESLDNVYKIPIDYKIKRFDIAFSKSKAEDLASLKSEFPYLFPNSYPNSFWGKKLNDELHRELVNETVSQFSDFSIYEKEIISLFQHTKHYFPDFYAPAIITLISDVDFRSNIILTDTLALLSLDTFLGEEHNFYKGIPYYIRKNMNKKQMLIFLAEKIAEKQIQKTKSLTFLDYLIYYGKLNYLKEKLLPTYTVNQILNFTEDELEWLQKNEKYIWGYFIDRELIYSTNKRLLSRFIYNAPFSKFYLEIDNQSPSRVGQYIGWRIVSQFMKNEKNNLNKMITLDTERIFKKSKYKPKK